MSTSSAHLTAGPAAGTVFVAPPPFEVDQGALRLDPGRACRLEHSPGHALTALTAAIDAGLHAGRPLFDQIRQQTAALAALRLVPAAERGRLLQDLLTGSQPAAKVDAALRAGLLHHVVPEVERLQAMPRGNGLYKDVYVHTLRVLDATPDDGLTRLAALLHDIAKPDTLMVEGSVARFPNHDLLGADRAGRRLRALGLPRVDIEAVTSLVRLHLRANSYEQTWTDSAVRRLHLDAGAHWQRLLDLSFADVTSARADVVERAHQRVLALAEHAASLDQPCEVSPLDGDVLMKRYGRGPGRWIGDVKQHLVDLVREGAFEATDEAAAWLAADRFVEREA